MGCNVLHRNGYAVSAKTTSYFAEIVIFKQDVNYSYILWIIITLLSYS